MNAPPDILEGPRVRLRRSVPDDAPETFRLAADPEVMRYLDWAAHRNEDDAREYLDGCAQRWEDGLEYHWAIERVGSGRVLGCISVRMEEGVADFGYFLGRAHWGRRRAFEACGLLLGWLRAQPDIRRIQATTDFENDRSTRLLERLGLRLESVRPSATIRPQLGGARRDTRVYVLASEENG
jgi:RimJ/RimL family protein N-acetyltransferase